jgi:hypothetical protein
LLNLIRQKMAANLTRLPNYTCVETIERSMRVHSQRNLKPIDTVRLEVAFVGGKELVAWPGAHKFEETNPRDMIKGIGATATGDFALHVHNLFMTTVPVISQPVEDTWNGHKSFRYDFRIDHGWRIQTDRASATVGYHGTFWVDSQTLDLLQLEARADDIPRDVGITSDYNSIEYGRVRIGESDFLLPLSSELVMLDRNGGETRNRTRFSGCRQYLGQTVLRFDEPSSAPEPVKAQELPPLPAGLSFEVSLANGVDLRKAAIGDTVSATVPKAVKKGSTVLLPKGAMLTGNITRMEQRKAAFGEYYVVGLHFSSLEAGNSRTDFLGHLEEVAFSASREYFVPFSSAPGSLSIWNSIRDPLAQPQPGEGVLYAKPASMTLPAGLRMVWRTLPQTQ